MLHKQATTYMKRLTVPGEIKILMYVYFEFWQFKLRIAKG